MRAARCWVAGVPVVLLPVMLILAGPARAGFLDDVGGALEKAGKDITEGVKKVGEELGVGGEGTSGKGSSGQGGAKSAPAAPARLPGGVTSRIKKMHVEMDNAEKALAKGAGTGVDRANRAEQSLKRARGYKAEIEKQYAGQYPDDHPDVDGAFDRLAKLEESVRASGREASAAEDAARKARADDKAAAARDEADRKDAEKAGAESAARARQRAEEDCEGWNGRLKVYTEGDKALYRCIGGSEADMAKCKVIYDEAVALRREFGATALAADPCGALDSTVSDLDRYVENFRPVYERYEKKTAAAKANRGEIVFSKKPIDPLSPGGLTAEFEAGDYIYGLIRTTRPWSEIYENGKSADVMVNVRLDGKKIHAQFVGLRKPDLLKRQHLVFEVAPDPGKMTAYGDPGVEYGKSTATMRQGPNELTYHLGEAGPGSHTMEFEVQYGGTVWAAGGFTVKGKDFGKYARMHGEIAEGLAQSVTLPAAGMTDGKMVKEMEALLENAGWKKIRRVNIVDKDWWIDRVSGGDSPVKSRHIAAAALARDGDGYYYKVCTFHQDKLITGAFGRLYLSHQGDRVPVAKKNIDK